MVERQLDKWHRVTLSTEIDIQKLLDTDDRNREIERMHNILMWCKFDLRGTELEGKESINFEGYLTVEEILVAEDMIQAME